MYSEAKSTPVRPPGQSATSVTFDPHRPVCPVAPLHSKMTLSTKFLSSNTHTVMLMQIPRHSEELWLESSFFCSPFLFRKASLVASGLWRTLGFSRNFTAVLTWNKKSAISVWVRLARRQREKEKNRLIPNRNSSSCHKWIPFDSFFRAPTPSCEEVRPPDHFPAKCGEWPNQQL